MTDVQKNGRLRRNMEKIALARQAQSAPPSVRILYNCVTPTEISNLRSGQSARNSWNPYKPASPVAADQLRDVDPGYVIVEPDEVKT